MSDYETIETTAHPMLYVCRKSSMDSAEIGRVMEEAFGQIGSFIARKGVTPAGPPFAIYRGWDGRQITVEVGFPVTRDQLGKTDGELNAGETPARKAIKAVHRGPYDGLRKTYGELEAWFRDNDLKMPDLSWEIYVSDPDKVAPEDLVTEIYMPLPE